jgi:hypothetical protein
MAMNPRTFTRVVIANLLVLLPLAVFLPGPMIRPGQTIEAHRAFADDCFACHVPFRGSQAGRCIACHKVADIGLRTTTGEMIDGQGERVAFHRQLLEEDCVACHSDHRGVKPFRPIQQFSHELLQPDLQQQCHGCHTKPGDSLHRRIDANCGQCHTQQGWRPATFDHRERFRFDADHETACATCHVDEDYSRYTCYGCHEHSRSRIREEHWEEGIRDFEDCVQCHRSGDEDEAKYLWRRRQSGASSGTLPGDREHRHRERDDD